MEKSKRYYTTVVKKSQAVYDGVQGVRLSNSTLTREKRAEAQT
jgi:hypothetical protein